MTDHTPTLLALGYGFSARALSLRLIPEGWRILGTVRDPEKAPRLEADGVEPVPWSAENIAAALGPATHLLMSAPPGEDGDPALAIAREAIEAKAPDLHWAGYLSTTGVYGDHHGAWVDETTPLLPTTPRGQARVEAEAAWGSIPHLPLHVFRLAGIYGPGRGPFEKLRRGRAQRIVKPGQVFSRIHVDDIAAVLAASIERPNPGAVYNVCDDDPAPPQDVLAYAAELLGLPVPPEVPFETAEMSEMARSFYSDNKRVANDRIKTELGVELAYPDYRSGLLTLLEAEAA
ncbi:SDR family oxidoreductase [Roseivivax sediminis]|uniref:Nucleoside-diphosphate-sugar epimerase n=1 Tax=Roseivivax sediminis TaxID=936889 RepID=A0A1I1UHN3_9RHOB|nr:SDR family oxidoreductase [Roseivivax sediminis]SFD70095.1 Nucleoside-diphosphate-sugar epimerase [Roseivivax sediminis]